MSISKQSEGKDYAWEQFEIYADANEINLNHEDDYGPWWNCWKSALSSHGIFLSEEKGE